MAKFKFFVPTKIFFGKGQLSSMNKRGLPGKKALIVISSGKSARENGYLARVEEQLDTAKIEHVIFDKVRTNPYSLDVEEGALFARENGCDMVVGLGGGSAIDTAKLIAVLATNDGRLWDYVIGGTGKRQRIKNKPLPVIAIPTTAGTGSEADQWAVSTNELGEKIGFGSDDTFPYMAFVDPDLMMSVPPHLTAYQGFDALFHGIECYISKYANYMSDIYCLQAIELVSRSLKAAVDNGSDEKAREDLALGSMMAGVAEALSTTAGNHALEHALSACHHDLPHGAGLIMTSAAYYKALASVNGCDDKMIAMAKAMGRADATSSSDFIAALKALIKECGMDKLKMSDYGITPSRFEEYISIMRATNAGILSADPKALSEAQWLEVLKSSYK